MSLHEFDELIERMQLVFGFASNLGQYVEAVKILYQMNEQLPDDLQLNLELEGEDATKSFISKYQPMIKSAIVKYRQRLMNF